MTHAHQPNTPRTSLVEKSTKVYRVTWLIGCAGVAAVGVTVLAIHSLAVVVTLFVAFALVGATLVLAWLGRVASRPGQVARDVSSPAPSLLEQRRRRTSVSRPSSAPASSSSSSSSPPPPPLR